LAVGTGAASGVPAVAGVAEDALAGDGESSVFDANEDAGNGSIRMDAPLALPGADNDTIDEIAGNDTGAALIAETGSGAAVVDDDCVADWEDAATDESSARAITEGGLDGVEFGSCWAGSSFA
jgi:hypothetical protein